MDANTIALVTLTVIAAMSATLYMIFPADSRGRDVLASGFAAIFIALGGALLTGLVMVAGVCVMVFPFKWVWNWLMPMKFGLPYLNFWEAWGLLFIGAALFKSSGSGSSKKSLPCAPSGARNGVVA